MPPLSFPSVYGKFQGSNGKHETSIEVKLTIGQELIIDDSLGSILDQEMENL